MYDTVRYGVHDFSDLYPISYSRVFTVIFIPEIIIIFVFSQNGVFHVLLNVINSLKWFKLFGFSFVFISSDHVACFEHDFV